MTRMVRKQLFITEEQNRKLKEQAAATGVSEANLIRAGIDLRLEQGAQDPRAWQDIVDETVTKLSGAWAERGLDRGDARDTRSVEPTRSDERGTPTGMSVTQ